jgi:VanZ family protein
MNFPRTAVSALRITLFVTLFAVNYLAFTDQDIPAINQVSDKLRHAFAFAVLAFLVDFSFPASRFGIVKILLLLGYGAAIEAVQYFLPYREASGWDLLADAAGIAAYLLSIPVLKRAPWFRLRWQAVAAP